MLPLQHVGIWCSYPTYQNDSKTLHTESSMSNSHVRIKPPQGKDKLQHPFKKTWLVNLPPPQIHKASIAGLKGNQWVFYKPLMITCTFWPSNLWGCSLTGEPPAVPRLRGFSWCKAFLRCACWVVGQKSKYSPNAGFMVIYYGRKEQHTPLTNTSFWTIILPI